METPETQRASGYGASPIIFVKNAKGTHFSVIDEREAEIVEKLGEGKYPHLAEFHPNGKTAYLSYLTSATIEVVDLETLEVVDRNDEPGKGNVGLEVSRCGRYLFAGSYGPFPEGGGPGVSIFDTGWGAGDLELLDRIDTDSSTTGMRLDSTGNLWVGLMDRNEVARISTEPPFEIAETYETGEEPHDIYFFPERQLMLVNNAEDYEAHLFDTLSNELYARVETTYNPHGGAMVLNDGETKLFVPSREEDELTVVELSRVDEVAGDVEFVDDASTYVDTGSPQAFAEPTRDGSYVLVDAYEGNEISIIDTSTEELVRKVEVGDTPVHPRISSDGTKAFVGSMGDDAVTVVDLKPLYSGEPERVKVLNEIENVGKEPSGLFRSWEAFR